MQVLQELFSGGYVRDGKHVDYLIETPADDITKEWKPNQSAKDGDGDGLIYDGTPQERLAARKESLANLDRLHKVASKKVDDHMKVVMGIYDRLKAEGVENHREHPEYKAANDKLNELSSERAIHNENYWDAKTAHDLIEKYGQADVPQELHIPPEIDVDPEQAQAALNAIIQRPWGDESSFWARRYKFKLKRYDKYYGSYDFEVYPKNDPEPEPTNAIEEVPDRDGFVYRGMSWEEWNNAVANGYIESRGSHNLGDAQDGLTFYGSASTAKSYATGFAPIAFSPMPGVPGVVIEIPRSLVKSHEDNPEAIPESEFAHEGRVSLDQISSRWEMAAKGSDRPGRVSTITEHGQVREGSRFMPGSSISIVPVSPEKIRTTLRHWEDADTKKSFAAMATQYDKNQWVPDLHRIKDGDGDGLIFDGTKREQRVVVPVDKSQAIAELSQALADEQYALLTGDLDSQSKHSAKIDELSDKYAHLPDDVFGEAGSQARQMVLERFGGKDKHREIVTEGLRRELPKVSNGNVLYLLKKASELHDDGLVDQVVGDIAKDLTDAELYAVQQNVRSYDGATKSVVGELQNRFERGQKDSEKLPAMAAYEDMYGQIARGNIEYASGIAFRLNGAKPRAELVQHLMDSGKLDFENEMSLDAIEKHEAGKKAIVEDMLKDLDKNWSTYEVDDSGNINAEEFRKTVKAGIVKKLTDMTDLSDQELATFGADSKEEYIQKIIDQWAKSSGDNEPLSCAIQLAVASEFGLGEGDIGGTTVGSVSLGRKMYDRNKDGLSKVVRAIYENTQESLKRAGVENITLYRGVEIGAGAFASVKTTKTSSDLALTLMAAAHFPNVEYDTPQTSTGKGTVIDAELNLNPASSFALSCTVARSFGALNNVYGNGMYAATVVPRERIFSTFATGQGCLTESEFVVMGGAPLPSKVLVPLNSMPSYLSNEKYIEVLKSAGSIPAKSKAPESEVPW